MLETVFTQGKKVVTKKSYMEKFGGCLLRYSEKITLSKMHFKVKNFRHINKSNMKLHESQTNIYLPSIDHIQYASNVRLINKQNVNGIAFV